MNFYKFLSRDLVHHGFTYKEGLNIDTQEFNPTGSCEPGGLYYTSAYHLGNWLSANWPLVADVTLPPDAKTYLEPCGTKWKADRLVISNIRPLYVLFAAFGTEAIAFLLWNDQVVTQLGSEHRIVLDQNEEDCLRAVQFYGENLAFIERQTPAICAAAVRQNGNAIRHVKQQTPALCWLAIKNTCWSIRHMVDPPHDVCVYVIDNAPHCAQYIKPTRDLQIEYPHLW